jgi:hypothetical protein
VPVKGSKLAAMGSSQGQQVAVSNLSGIQKPVCIESALIEYRYIVWPELMPAEATQDFNSFCDK